MKNLVSVRNCRELSHYRCDLQEQITQSCFEHPPNIPRLCRSACWRCSRTHASITTYDMRGRIWLLLQVSSPAALFPRVYWECVKACQTVGDQLIIASYWGPS